MRYLITGGAGFIGSHLGEVLLERGEQVHVLDDLSTGRLENVEHLQGYPNFAITTASVSDEAVVAELIAEADAVVHLAAAVGVRLVVERPVHAIETNVHCTEVVLAHADEHRKPVLLASTSEVYGKSEALPFKEDGDLRLGATDKARWAYACSKAIDEFLAMAYWRERALPITIARLFNTVGPRQTGRYGMVVPRLVEQALADEPLTVYGDGTQTRCFCHVADVVQALAALLDDLDARGGVFNVGATEEISILELAHLILELTGSRSEVRFTPYDRAYGKGFEDMFRRVPDIAKIRALTGWSPRRSLADVIRDVAQERSGTKSFVDQGFEARETG
jgi:nucleoside-diphosphate-sugar epimerase